MLRVGMLALLDLRARGVTVLPELAPARALPIPPPGLAEPRGLALLGDDLVVADVVTGGLARWDARSATWTHSHAGAFVGASGVAADAAGQILVTAATGLWRVATDGTTEGLEPVPAGARCVAVAVDGDGRIAVTLAPGGLVVSDDGGMSWQLLGAPARPGPVAGLAKGFAVVDAATRTVEVLGTGAPTVTLGAAHGLVAPSCVAPATDGVVIADATTGRVRRFVLLADRVVPAEFVDGLTRPGFPPLFERVGALAAPLPTGADR